MAVLGSVAFVAGGVPVIFGAESIIGEDRVSATIDSEVRFFAAWYAAMGVVILRAVPRIELERNLVRGVAAVFFIAGCARGLSWATVGRPHTFSLVLMGIELVLPFMIIPWQASLTSPAKRIEPSP